MAAATTPLVLFISFILLFTLYWFTPIFRYHHSSPTQAHIDLQEALTNFLEPSQIEREYDDTNLEPFPGPHSFGSSFNNYLFDDKNVVVLSEKNFSDFISNNKYVMVMFYASWCHWSWKLAPEYAAAAELLKGGEAVLASVDCVEESMLANKYDIHEYPLMYLFVGGVKQFLYCNNRTRDAITRWVKMKVTLGVYDITETDDAERVLSAQSQLVLGFLNALQSSDSEELVAASKLHSNISFYQTDNPDVAKLFHIDPQIRRPILIFLESQAGKYSLFDGQFTKSAITDFVYEVTVKPPLSFEGISLKTSF